MSKQAIKNDLIKEVRDLAKQLGRTPKRREFKRQASACHYFKTWGNFIIAAGLKPLRLRNLTMEEYAEIIHDFVKKHGRTPTLKDFYDDIYLPDPTAIEERFQKNWSGILEELGYKPNIRMNVFLNTTDEELLQMLKDELIRIGSTRKTDYEEKRKDNAPSVEYLIRRLNMKWNELLDVVGLDRNVVRRSSEEWLEMLKNVAGKLGETPSINDLPKYGLNESVYKLRFGSYNNAIREAGLIPNVDPVKVTHTDEELLNIYIELCKKLGRVATSKDIDGFLPYKSDVFAIRFGGLNRLRELAGYEPYYSSRKYTKTGIRNMLIETYHKYGRRLTISELKKLSKSDEHFPSVTTIMRYFATTKINEVWEEIINEQNIRK